MKRGRLILGAIIALVLVLLVFWFRGSLEHEHEHEHEQPKSVRVAKEQTAERRTASLPSLYVPPAKAAKSDGEIVFSGRVVSRANGAGIADAEMTFSEEEASHTVNTALDGVFRFVAPKPGTYQLAAVTAKDFLPFAPAWGESPLVLTARAGQSITDLVVYLEPEKIISAKVIDERDRAVSGASITLFVPASENMTLVSLEAKYTTDAQGAFRFRAPIGTLIEAQHPDFDVAQERFTESAHAKGEMTIRLHAKSAPVERASIAGKVVIENGTGLPNALISAGHADRDPFKGELDWWTTKSDADGRFTLDGLLPGKYTLMASSPGLVSARADAVEAGTKDVVLRLQEQGGFISGRVTSSAGGVPSFAVVLSKPLGKLEESAVGTRSFLDPEGRFSIGPLEASNYLVRVVAQGFSASDPQTIDVAAGKTSHADFHLGKGATLIGVVLNAETSAPIAGAKVELEGRGVQQELPIEVESIVTSGADGSFALAGIGPGLRAIDVEAKGFDTRIISAIEIEEDATVGPIEVKLTPLATPDAEPKRELTGIGAALAAEKDVLVIGQVFEGGGAFEAGLVAGDRIVAIEGQSVGELDMNGAINRIRGPEGTTVRLTIRRANGGEQDFEVFRRKIRA